MGLFSFLSKNKQEAASAEGEFYSRAEEDSQVARGRGKRKQAKSASSANSSNNTNSAGADPVLPEKKRARRRLVGAIALVLAMIIGLPMILDSEQKPVSDDIAIQIPSKDKPGALNTIPAPSAAPVSASSPTTVPVASSLSPQEQVVQMPKTSAASVPVAAIATAPASVKTVVVPPVKAKDDIKPQAKPESKPDVKPETAHDTADAKSGKVDHTAEKHDDARAEAILEGKSADSTKPAADKKGAKFVVQVAALATQEKVTELQDKLTQAGFKSFVQKVPTEGGVRIRVRVGPFSTKDEAESTRAKLSKLGFNGRLAPA
ncbi:MAG TPA: SPOR domain-containing protein [Burkholderiaceae bacterium]|jgi:DedD protein|nr:SPOR domain-containing protein [Burkholderiaceae bacterium]